MNGVTPKIMMVKGGYGKNLKQVRWQNKTKSFKPAKTKMINNIEYVKKKRKKEEIVGKKPK